MISTNFSEPVSMNDPTAPYYDGHNWKSAMSVSNELDRHTHSVVKDYWRIRAQMDDSLNRLDLGYEVSHICMSPSIKAFCRDRK